MDENQNKEQPNEEEIKKAEEQEEGRKTAHTAGKAAATYFGGAAGNKIYDLASKTKLGRGIENAAGKVIQHSPAKHLANVANKTGALDVADKGINIVRAANPKIQPQGKSPVNIIETLEKFFNMVPLAEPSPEFFPLLSSFESNLVLLPSVVLELF